MSSSSAQKRDFSGNGRKISISTPLGDLYAISGSTGIIKIGWDNASYFREDDAPPDSLRKWFDCYFRGEITDFPLIDMRSLSVFASDVTTTLVEMVPYGTTISYKDLARLSGYPNASRAVGNVMSENPWPILVPCHRVISSDGSLGNYSGRGGKKTKLKLINMEGGIR